MKPLILRRKVKLEKFDALLEISRQQKREEFIAVLMLASENGGRITATDICTQLLLGRPETVGKAVLARCRDLDLLDDRGEITETGRKALATRNVFLPERGRFLVWYTEDPLLPQRLLHIQPVEEPRLFDEVKKGGDDKDTDEALGGNSETLPEKLHYLEGKEFNLIGTGGGFVILRRVEPYGIIKSLAPDDGLSLTLRLEARAPPHLEVDGKFRFVLPTPNVDYNKAWLEALGPLSAYWDDRANPSSLRLRFADLKDDERALFRKTVNLAEPQLDEWGAFEDTSVGDVPVRPLTREDAAQWAEWLLIKSINTYLTPNQYQKRADECSSRFPDFPSLKIPSSTELARKLWRQKEEEGRVPPQYWYLRAPLDLQIHKPDEKEGETD